MITIRKVTMGWMVERIDETDRATHAVHVIRRDGKFFAYTHDFRDRWKLLRESESFLDCARAVRLPGSAVVFQSKGETVNNKKFVVRVTTLKDFQKEVPSGTVRLLSSKYQISAQPLPTIRFSLSLQGVNAQGEIVWLNESHAVMVGYDGKGFGPDNASIIAGMSRLAEIARDVLIAQGHDVRDSDYGLPDSIKPLKAHFECAEWKKVGEREWEVVPVAP